MGREKERQREKQNLELTFSRKQAGDMEDSDMMYEQGTSFCDHFRYSMLVAEDRFSGFKKKTKAVFERYP